MGTTETSARRCRRHRPGPIRVSPRGERHHTLAPSAPGQRHGRWHSTRAVANTLRSREEHRQLTLPRLPGQRWRRPDRRCGCRVRRRTHRAGMGRTPPRRGDHRGGAAAVLHGRAGTAAAARQAAIRAPASPGWHPSRDAYRTGTTLALQEYGYSVVYAPPTRFPMGLVLMRDRLDAVRSEQQRQPAARRGRATVRTWRTPGRRPVTGYPEPQPAAGQLDLDLRQLLVPRPRGQQDQRVVQPSARIRIRRTERVADISAVDPFAQRDGIKAPVRRGDLRTGDGVAALELSRTRASGQSRRSATSACCYPALRLGAPRASALGRHPTSVSRMSPCN
jgi:hypothetical protein